MPSCRGALVLLVACAAPAAPRVLRNRSGAVGAQVDVAVVGESWRLAGPARLDHEAIKLELCGGRVASAMTDVTLPQGMWTMRAEHTNTDCTTATELRATRSGRFLASVVLSARHGSVEAQLVLSDETKVSIDIGAYGGSWCCGTTEIRALTFVRR